MFSGQGTQFVGMTRVLYYKSVEVKMIIDYADDFLQKNCNIACSIRDLMFNGPEDLLAQTMYSQLAIFISEVAIFKKFIDHYVDISIVTERCSKNFVKFCKLNSNTNFSFCGHSLGEYSALCCAGVIDFESALSLIVKRGQLMMNAPKGGMVAVLGVDDKIHDIVHYATENGDICVIANYNCNGQIVLSGTENAIARVVEFCEDNTIKHIKLPVSGGFHSPLMIDAQNIFAEELKKVRFFDAIGDFYSSISGITNPITNGNDIKDIMMIQMVSSVMWIETMKSIKCISEVDDNTKFIEISPKSVLKSLAKKTGFDVMWANFDDIL
ncbi:ACP S-malonyltransferase [Candidatus Gromoviella agglomerans]|nr:ACP S-malonyltransferase [Candidatus Gromoviella agglomerans]